jgi:Domain of unknown function (DUF3869)
MKNILPYLLTFFVSTLFFSCKKTEVTPSPAPPPANPCTGVTITPVVTKASTITGQMLGTITVTSPIGSGYTYSIGGTAFQGSVNFFNLSAGAYTLTAKSADGCSGTATININGYGAKFYAVRNLVNANCGPCHLNGGNSGGKNWDTDDAVVASWDRIKARAVDNLPSVMPQSGPLTAPDKQKIVDWVNAGHKITD